jgi:hypothetical protein
MAEVFLCKTGQLTAASRRELKRAGVVVVEVEDPASCQFIQSSAPVSSDDMLWAACDALRRTYTNNYSDGRASTAHREAFAVNVFELVDAARSARRPAAPEAS